MNCHERLPDGSRGIFIGSYQLQRSQIARNEIITMLRFHTRFRSSHAKWIRTNLIDENRDIAFEGAIMTLKEYFLSRRIAPGVFLYHQMIKRRNYLGETIIYLICNNSFGQSATITYRDLVNELKEHSPEVSDAFEDALVGALSAITHDTGPHLKLPSALSKDTYSATLARTIEAERKRIDNVYIEGVKIKDIHQRPRRNMKIVFGNTQEEVEELDMMEDPMDSMAPATALADDDYDMEDNCEHENDWKIVGEVSISRTQQHHL